jgi:hypothetical protein
MALRVIKNEFNSGITKTADLDSVEIIDDLG